jgi:hypothetical protein
VVVYLVGSAEAEAAARPMVEFGGDVVALALGEIAHGSSFGQVLAEEPVGILVGSALPGVVWGGEVDGGAERLLELLVAVELSAVIGSEGADAVRFVGEQSDEAGVGVLDGGARQRADADHTALALDCGDDAGLAAAMDGVEFPVPVATTAVYDRGPLTDPATAVFTGIALASLLGGAAKMAPERTPIGLIVPDIEIDGLVAHHRYPLAGSAPHDLLWAPPLLKQCLDGGEVDRAVACVSARSAPPSVRHLRRHLRTIRAVVWRGVSLHLSGYRTAMPPEHRRDLRRSQSLASHRCDMISFVRAQLPIAHRSDMSHLLPESKRPNQALQPTAPSGRG